MEMPAEDTGVCQTEHKIKALDFESWHNLYLWDVFADKRLKMQNSELEDDKTPWGQALDMPYIVKIVVI